MRRGAVRGVVVVFVFAAVAIAPVAAHAATYTVNTTNFNSDS